MNLFFGHKDLPQRKHQTLSTLLFEKSFDLGKAKIYTPLVQASISGRLDNGKQSAQSYLDSTLHSYTAKTAESFRSSIHDLSLAIKRRL